MSSDYPVKTSHPHTAARQRQRDRVNLLCLAIILAGGLVVMTVLRLQNVIV